jgi:hypothetical protein
MPDALLVLPDLGALTFEQLHWLVGFELWMQVRAARAV